VNRKLAPPQNEKADVDLIPDDEPGLLVGLLIVANEGKQEPSGQAGQALPGPD
jgi:hypothetical protein